MASQRRKAAAVSTTGVLALLVSGSASASVFPPDTRTTINTTTNPNISTAPMTWNAALTSVARFGNIPYCSAWFYDNNTVATAGHCVWADWGDGTPNWVTSAGAVYVSRTAYWNGSAAIKPYGSCTAGGTGFTVAASSTWTASQNKGYDYGAVRVQGDCTLPSTWFTMSSSSPSVAAGATYVSGYPHDLGAGAMPPLSPMPYNLVKAQGQMLGVLANPGRLCYDVDTGVVQSGGPIYQTPSIGLRAYGIHAYGSNTMPGCALGQNAGIWLTTTVQNDLNGWRNP